MELLGAIAATGVLQSSLQKPIEAACSSLAKGVKGVVKRYKAAEVAPRLADRVEELGRVRTLFNEQPVSLNSFYFPSTVRDSQMRARSIKDISEFGSHNVAITGTLGQGKSMFMRWLSLAEAMRGETIPVFIELRKIDEKTTLEALLLHALTLLGFEQIDSDTLHHLLHEGRLTIFLDGFDEVRRLFALPVQQEIATNTVKHPKTRWIVSCRPGNLEAHLHSIPKMRFFALAPLREEDLEPFLKRINIEETQRSALLAQVDKTSWNIKGVLTTPLMVSLLAATFCQSNGVPTSLHAFYLSLFHVAAWRHDGLKTAFQRERVTQLSDDDLLSVFEAFCFRSKSLGVSLTDDQFNTCAKDAATVTKKDFHPNALRADLMEGVCLMMRDSLNVAFIHKGVQEFFAASFIKKATKPALVEQIYADIRGKRCSNWLEEIKFLQAIDEYRYYELLRIPVIEQSLQALGFERESRIGITKANFMKAMRAICPGIVKFNERPRELALLSIDAAFYNVESAQLFGLPGMYNFPVPLEDAEDVARPSTEIARNYTFESWTGWCRANPRLAEQHLERVRDRARTLDRELVRLKRTVANHDGDVSKILLSVATS